MVCILTKDYGSDIIPTNYKPAKSACSERNNPKNYPSKFHKTYTHLRSRNTKGQGQHE